MSKGREEKVLKGANLVDDGGYYSQYLIPYLSWPIGSDDSGVCRERFEMVR